MAPQWNFDKQYLKGRHPVDMKMTLLRSRTLRVIVELSE